MYRSDPSGAALTATAVHRLDELLSSAAAGRSQAFVIDDLLGMIVDVLGFKDARSHAVRDEEAERLWEQRLADAQPYGGVRLRPGSGQLITAMRPAARGGLIGVVVVDVAGDLPETSEPERRRLDLLELAVRQVGYALDAAHQVTHDPLTGLLNWTGVHRRLEDLVSRERDPSRPGVVMFCDLNGYKKVNDRFGHLVGDDVLATVGRRIEESVRASDLVGRYGGDEFVLILPDIGRRQADEAAARVLAAVGQPIVIQEESLTVGASLGVVVVDAPATAREVLDRADQAMYVVKRKNAGSQYVVQSLADRPVTGT